MAEAPVVDDWDATWWRSVAEGVAYGVQSTGALTASSILRAAAALLAEAWDHMDDQERLHMARIVHQQSLQLDAALQSMVAGDNLHPPTP
jgi:hypothetical protein